MTTRLVKTTLARLTFALVLALVMLVLFTPKSAEAG
jgi:hypothetical protein